MGVQTSLTFFQDISSGDVHCDDFSIKSAAKRWAAIRSPVLDPLRRGLGIALRALRGGLRVLIIVGV